MTRAWVGAGFTALMTLALAVLVRDSFELGPVAGWAPRRVIVLTLILFSVQLVRDLAQARAPQAAADSERPSEWRRERSSLAWAFLAFVSLWFVGFQLGAPAFVAWFLRRRARASWREVLVSSAAVALALYGLSYATDVRLYRGWL